MSKAEADTTSGKPFSELIREAERGQLDHDLTRQLNQVIRAVRETGGKGAVKLTMSIQPNGHEALQVTIEHKIDAKIPQASRAKTLAYTTPQGGLQREDPRQTVMEGFQDHE